MNSATSISQIEPLRNQIVLRPELVPATTPGGLIVIPEAARQKGQEAEVLAVGPGLYDKDMKAVRPIPLKVGERVLVQLYAGVKLNISAEEFLVVREEDIIARIKPASVTK